MTSIDSSNGNLIITWNEPNNRNSAINKYFIEIRNKLTTLWPEEQTYCDGTNAEVVTNRYCSIPMTVLSSSPYSLSRGDLVVVRITAHNANGWGTVSSPNSYGSTVRTVPA